MEYYSAIKTNELLRDATTWMSLKHGVKESRHDRTHPIWFHLHEALDLVKLINCNRNLVSVSLSQGWGGGEGTYKDHERNFWSDGTILCHIEVAVALVPYIC